MSSVARWLALLLLAALLVLVPTVPAQTPVEDARPPACLGIGPDPYLKLDPVYCVTLVAGIVDEVVGQSDA